MTTYTKKQFDSAKCNDKLPCKCTVCGTLYFKLKRVILRTNKVRGFVGLYCSPKCQTKCQQTRQTYYCTTCNTPFIRTPTQVRKSKNLFCSQSCAAVYNNTHKTKGTRRSKLELWLEQQLIKLYPSLEIHFNRKDAIKSELDIYIPSLKLAFELNGIFHYEPIFGQPKLNQIQENDSRKFKLCHDAKINLCIIDSSQMKHFKERRAKSYLKIITNIISEHGHEDLNPDE